MKINTTKSILRILKEKIDLSDELYNRWFPKRGFKNIFDTKRCRYQSLSVVKTDKKIYFISFVTEHNTLGNVESEFAIGTYPTTNFDDVLQNPLKDMEIKRTFSGKEYMMALRYLARLTTGQSQARYF